MELECSVFQRPVFKDQIVKVYENDFKRQVKYGKVVVSEKIETIDNNKMVIEEVLYIDEIPEPEFKLINWFLPPEKVRFLTYLPE